jgi:hypothetical protein
MSGGHFDYTQYQIGRISDEVEELILKNGQKREYKEAWENEYHNEYSPEVIEKFKEGLMLLKKAEIYAQRIDWLVSGDDGEESFFRRLQEELDELEILNKNL